MTPKRFILRVSALLAGMGVMVVVLEILLRFMPILDGAYAADPNGKWPLHVLVPNSSYTFSVGWNASNLHRGRINNFGYVSPRDYTPGEAGIVVIGDSYIESLMNDYNETLQGELTRYLETAQPVLNFGMSGADLPHYLGTAEAVGKAFSPTWAVVLVTKGDYKDGFKADTGYFRWAPKKDPPIELVPEVTRSRFEKVARGLALVRYIRGNLAIRFGDLIHLHRAIDGDPAAKTAACSRQTLSAQDESIVDRYADALPKALGLLPARVILVFDADRKAIYAGTPAAAVTCPSIDELARTRLMEVAAARGMRVIDSAPIFERWYASTRQQVDYLPQDGHWNPIAHRLMAQEVARVINESGSLAVPPASSHAALPDTHRRVAETR